MEQKSVISMNEVVLPVRIRTAEQIAQLEDVYTLMVESVSTMTTQQVKDQIVYVNGLGAAFNFPHLDDIKSVTLQVLESAL